MTNDILRTVHRTSGVDFSAYRPQTLERRIRSRMMSLGIDDLAGYDRVLRESAEEVQFLIGRLTIKVSRFYRNPQVFDILRVEALPQLARTGRPVRAWSAGCGRGEEAYTLAMLMEEASIPGDVLGTDIDPLALRDSEAATYPEAALVDLPKPLATRFLKPRVEGACEPYEVCGTARRRVAFAQADLITPGRSGERFDLICCRNVLIYWDPATQRAILRHLLSKLRGGGWLCLGEAEWPDRCFAELLEPVAARLRIFRATGMEEQR